MHELPADIERKLVDFILESRPLSASDQDIWRKSGHDKPLDGDIDRASHTWLGKHRDMASPGEITLHRDNLNQAFWSFIGGKSPDSIHYPNLCRSLIYMVLVHERFHHFCDVYGQITQCRGGEKTQRSPDWWKLEEALATTWEWQELQRSCLAFSKLPEALQKVWIEWWFDGITANGYKDWKKYRHFCLFKEALIEHLAIKGSPLINSAKSELTEWLYGQLVAQQWCDDAVVYAMETTGSHADISPPDFPPLHSPTYWIEGKTGQPLCGEGRKSLSKIHEKLPTYDGVLCLNGNPFQDSVLGLLLINGLEHVSCTGLSGDLLRAIEIVNKYLPNPKGIKGKLLECQNELLDAGLEEFAKL